jgi:hypothetical protein
MNILNRSAYRNLNVLNLNEFLGTQTTVASERAKLIPVNSEGYPAIIASDGIGLADFKFKKGDREGQTGYRMTVKWEIQDEAVKKELGRTPYITQSIMLNFTDSGALANENPGLRKLREAVGQNKDGQPWQPAMLIGQMARIKVKHSINPQNQEEQMEVEAVTSL